MYTSDAVERGRASWARYPEVFTSEPFFRTKKEGWELFRIGPTWDTDSAKRVAYPGAQFPTAAYDQFAKQFVPRWATNNTPTQAAYDALVQKVCPCVIVVHSQGSTFAFEAARKAPQLVKAVIAVEPSGALDATKVDIAGLKAVPHLFVWGDNLDKNATWTSILPPARRFTDAVKALGGVVDTIDLPAQGIKGNSHMVMMDKNSDQVAALIQAWMAKQGLMR